MSPSPPVLGVRRLDRGDLDRVLLLFGAYREFYERKPDPDRERTFLLERLDRDECVIFVAESGRRAIGFTLLYPLFSSLSLRPTWVLNDLYVLPEHRRRGVAARLLIEAREFARATGAEYLTLETARENPAQRLYEAEGWKRDDLFLHYELVL
ncbi:MAG: GNAT family N-acetyltransferase [Thermoplasmata archaeon]